MAIGNPLICDTHLHSFDVHKPYNDATYVPPRLDIRHYSEWVRTWGVRRAVLVHASVDGDNCDHLLACLQSHVGLDLRGVVGVQTSDVDLRYLHDAGVRAIRIQDRSRLGVQQIQQLAEQARLASETQWHLEINTEPGRFDVLRSALESMPASVDLVLDHIGHLRPDDAAGRASLFRLMETGRVWVKLSLTRIFSHRLNDDYSPLQELVAALVQRFPLQCVWGSDWPHVMTEEPVPSLPKMLDFMRETLTSSQFHAVMWTNPQKLYDFPPVPATT